MCCCNSSEEPALLAGLLLYCDSCTYGNHDLWHLQIASLIMQRNVLAARLGRNRSLPPMLGDPNACSRCFQVSNCSLLHKVRAVISS